MSEARRVRIADERLRSRPLHRPRKNRKRWCRGRKGVEHDWGFWEPGYGPTHLYLNSRVGLGRLRELWAYRVCETCGRVEHFIGTAHGAV